MYFIIRIFDKLSGGMLAAKAFFQKRAM